MMRHPYPYPPIIIPEPEVLRKYIRLAGHLLRLTKIKATQKGREHKKRLKELCE